MHLSSSSSSYSSFFFFFFFFFFFLVSELMNDLYLFQRNLDQLEALSKKLKAKTVRAEAPSQSIAATRFLYDSCCIILTRFIT
jgi:hypothetical protein